MKRRDFLKRAVGGTAVAALAPLAGLTSKASGKTNPGLTDPVELSQHFYESFVIQDDTEWFFPTGHGKPIKMDNIFDMPIGTLIKVGGVTYTIIELCDDGKVLLDRPLETTVSSAAAVENLGRPNHSITGLIGYSYIDETLEPIYST